MSSIISILDDLNKEPKTIIKYKDNATIRSMFEYAFIPEKKFILPEGKPPYRPVDVPYTLRSANFMNEVRRFYIFTKERAELSSVRREALFIQLLEILHELEANIMIAIKDQKLTELYPNITYDLLAEYGFLPKKVVEVQEVSQEEPVEKKVTSRRGRKVVKHD